MRKPALHAFAVALALTAPSLAHALPSYSAMYVFGDSLSDRGNLAEGFETAFPNPPFYNFSFTNGPVAVSVLASRLGLAADASLWLSGFQDTAGIFPPGYVPGTNYAVADATAQANAVGGLGGINLPDQVGAYLNHVGNVADPNALYTVFIGGNDVRDATLSGGPGGSAAINTAVATETQQIQSLINAGARQFLVVNVTDVGAIPQFALEQPSLAPLATSYSEQYDSGLAAALGTLAKPAGTMVTSFDLLSYTRQLLASASLFGITNTTDPCYVVTVIPPSGTPTAACGAGAANIGQFAFWNDVHPTSQVHALIADGFAQALNGNPSPSPIPEPGSVAAFVAGLLGLLGLRRCAGLPERSHVGG